MFCIGLSANDGTTLPACAILIVVGNYEEERLECYVPRELTLDRCQFSRKHLVDGAHRYRDRAVGMVL